MMPRKSRAKDGPSPLDSIGYDFTQIPDYDNDFTPQADIDAFAKALAGPDVSQDNTLSPVSSRSSSRGNLFITALNDWRPVYRRVRRPGKKRKKKPPLRGKDETREGFVYGLLKWPLFAFATAWLLVLGVSYLLTRLYIFLYEHFVTVRGRRHRIRNEMRAAATYDEWIKRAVEMDNYLGNDKWKVTDENAYYNSSTVRNVRDELKRLRTAIESPANNSDKPALADDLRALLESSVKNNFVGVENARLYSETYYGTKDLVQSFVDEVEASLRLLSTSPELSVDDKKNMYRHLYTNNGRTALCLSGGATFAYYHFGVAKALLDAQVLPEVITGTSGGALVAALLATRTDDELKKLLVPALANRITACSEPWTKWFPRWWRTGARFDTVDWARRCSWFTRGSLTFREAYERTGRILNVTCIPSDPHSPVVLANYLTAPDCVIWSAVLASAAVPGILNPVVLMKKKRDGSLAPYSLNLKDKWKDGSLRTDIPLRALNTHFNVNFSIVSQVNPHINLFFFSSRGTVGRPVSHRRGRGWRGGFLGSAIEQYLKLDLTKWLKVLRHLELLPRYMGQDWSEVWLQRFSGTITIWPRSRPSDFVHILTDPDPPRLARMIHEGQQSAFPKIKFVANRMKIERLIEDGRKATSGKDDFEWDTRLNRITGGNGLANGVMPSVEEDDRAISTRLRKPRSSPMNARSPHLSPSQSRPHSPNFSKRFGSRWWSAPADVNDERISASAGGTPGRRQSVLAELSNQTQVFRDDRQSDIEAEEEAAEEDEGHYSSAGEGDGSEYEDDFDGIEKEEEEEREHMLQW